MATLAGHGGMPIENEDDAVADIYVDQDEDGQEFMPGGDIQSITQRGEPLYRSARQAQHECS